MTTVLFTLLISTVILLSGFMDFATYSFLMLGKDFKRQAKVNTVTACWTYGDLLVRSKSITPGKPVKMPVGCVAWEAGTCMERLSCRITLTGRNKLNVELIEEAPERRR